MPIHIWCIKKKSLDDREQRCIHFLLSSQTLGNVVTLLFCYRRGTTRIMPWRIPSATESLPWVENKEQTTKHEGRSARATFCCASRCLFNLCYHYALHPEYLSHFTNDCK